MAGRQEVAPSDRVDPWLIAGGLVALLALLVYRATLLPGVGTWDTAEAQTVPPLMGTMHPTGFPAYVLLGWLWSAVLQPLGPPALLMNLLSAVLVSAAALGLVLVARRIGVGLPLAVAAAAGFALTPIAWAIAVAADVHALQIALLAVLVLLLLRWEARVEQWQRGDPSCGQRDADRALVVAAAGFGVAAASHGLTLLLLPAVGAYVLAVDASVLRRPRTVLASFAVSAGIAALLYLELPLRAGAFRAPLVYDHPETWAGFWSVVLGSQFGGSASSLLSDPLGALGSPFAIALDQLGPLALLVLVGLVVTIARRPRYALLSGLATALISIFALSYDNADIGRYYLGPLFFAWTWLALLGTAVIDWLTGTMAGVDGTRARISWGRRRTAATLVVVIALLAPTATGLATRWHGADRSNDRAAAIWLDAAFGAMAPDAMVVSWWSYSTPMWYGQLIEGRRPDIAIIDDRTRLDQRLGDVGDVIDANLDTRPVYVIRAQGSDLQALGNRFAIENIGHPANLYRVTRRQETSP